MTLSALSRRPCITSTWDTFLVALTGVMEGLGAGAGLLWHVALVVGMAGSVGSVAGGGGR